MFKIIYFDIDVKANNNNNILSYINLRKKAQLSVFLYHRIMIRGSNPIGSGSAPLLLGMSPIHHATSIICHSNHPTACMLANFVKTIQLFVSISLLLFLSHYACLSNHYSSCNLHYLSFQSPNSIQFRKTMQLSVSVSLLVSLYSLFSMQPPLLVIPIT